jgi:hypothetical protein
VCDIIVLYIMKKRDLYRTSKYQYVDVSEDQPTILVWLDLMSPYYLGSLFAFLRIKSN